MADNQQDDTDQSHTLRRKEETRKIGVISIEKLNRQKKELYMKVSIFEYSRTKCLSGKM
jgi:hypothetical protein